MRLCRQHYLGMFNIIYQHLELVALATREARRFGRGSSRATHEVRYESDKRALRAAESLF